MRASCPSEGRESRGVVTWDGTGAAPGNACPGPGAARGTRGRSARTSLWASSLAPAAGPRPGPGVGVKHRARDADRLPYKLGSSRRVPRNPPTLPLAKLGPKGSARTMTHASALQGLANAKTSIEEHGRRAKKGFSAALNPE